MPLSLTDDSSSQKQQKSCPMRAWVGAEATKISTIMVQEFSASCCSVRTSEFGKSFRAFMPICVHLPNSSYLLTFSRELRILRSGDIVDCWWGWVINSWCVLWSPLLQEVSIIKFRASADQLHGRLRQREIAPSMWGDGRNQRPFSFWITSTRLLSSLSQLFLTFGV